MLTNRIQSFVNKKFMNFNQMSLFVYEKILLLDTGCLLIGFS